MWEMRACFEFSCMIVACRTIFQKDVYLFQKIIHVPFTEMGACFIQTNRATFHSQKRGLCFIHRNGPMFQCRKWSHVLFTEMRPCFIQGHVSFTKMGPCFSSRNGAMFHSPCFTAFDMSCVTILSCPDPTHYILWSGVTVHFIPLYFYPAR